MKNLSRFFMLLLLAAGLSAAQNAAPAADQGPPPRHHHGMGMGGFPGGPGMGGDWWRNSDIAQQVGLTDAQKTQLSTIFSNHRGTLIQLRGNVENEEGKFRDLLEQDTPDQPAVMAELGKLQSARNALENEFTAMTLAFRGVLSPDQWKQLRSLSREHMGFHHRPNGGPGGDSPPPPPQQ
jgi:Spy/CpxP family protein refolding chaperone